MISNWTAVCRCAFKLNGIPKIPWHMAGFGIFLDSIVPYNAAYARPWDCHCFVVWQSSRFDLKMAAVGDQRDTLETPSLDKLAGFRLKNNPNKYTLNTKTSEIWWSKRLYRYFPVGMDYREFRDLSQIFGSTILERPFSDSNEMWKTSLQGWTL